MLWSYVQASTDVRPKVVWSYGVRVYARTALELTPYVQGILCRFWCQETLIFTLVRFVYMETIYFFLRKMANMKG